MWPSSPSHRALRSTKVLPLACPVLPLFVTCQIVIQIFFLCVCKFHVLTSSSSILVFHFSRFILLMAHFSLRGIHSAEWTTAVAPIPDERIKHCHYTLNTPFPRIKSFEEHLSYALGWLNLITMLVYKWRKLHNNFMLHNPNVHISSVEGTYLSFPCLSTPITKVTCGVPFMITSLYILSLYWRRLCNEWLR